MHIVLLLVGLVFIIYNLANNMSNFTRIVSYCWETGSVNDYWDLVFKACFHIRAIYSSIIMAVIAFSVFVVITPIILVRGIFVESRMAKRHSSGEVFKYADLNLHDQKFIYSNISELGLGKIEPTATGNVRIDLELAVGYIDDHFRKEKTYINQNVFESYDLSNGMQVQIPISIETADKVYPLYLIYNQNHKESYNKINPILKANNFQNALYLSIVPMY